MKHLRTDTRERSVSENYVPTENEMPCNCFVQSVHPGWVQAYFWKPRAEWHAEKYRCDHGSQYKSNL